MTKTNNEVEELIIKQGLGSIKQRKRIYQKFFKDWLENHKYIYKRFKLDLNKKIIDIGCGYGQNLFSFNADSIGVEINPVINKFSRKIGLNIKDINIEDDLNKIKQKFDIVWCSDLLVHMISPLKLLIDCKKLLTLNGKIVIQIPLMSIWGLHKSTCHWYAFNKNSLMYLMEMAGYKILKTSGYIRKLPTMLNYFGEWFLQIFGGNIWVLAKKCDQEIYNKKKVFLPKWF